MKRRDFLKKNIQATALLTLGGVGILNPSEALAEGKAPALGVAKGRPGPATRAAVDQLGGMNTFVKPGQRVVIKPNMSFANPPEMATTTHPDVVKALAQMCYEAGAADVLILDHPLSSAEMCLERSGILSACDAVRDGIVHGVETHSLFRDASISLGKDMKKNAFMKDVLKADVLIAAPVAKSHGSTGVSLSMKGMMGLIWDRGIMHSRYDLNQSIVDLNTKLKADLAVIDGTRVLTTNGPYGPGKVVRKNTVIASADPVAADAYAVAAFEWWGRKMRPNQVKHLRLAHEQGLGTIDINSLKVSEVTV